MLPQFIEQSHLGQSGPGAWSPGTRSGDPKTSSVDCTYIVMLAKGWHKAGTRLAQGRWHKAPGTRQLSQGCHMGLFYETIITNDQV